MQAIATTHLFYFHSIHQLVRDVMEVKKGRKFTLLIILHNTFICKTLYISARVKASSGVNRRRNKKKKECERKTFLCSWQNFYFSAFG
jgi:hypothetical protein